VSAHPCPLDPDPPVDIRGVRFAALVTAAVLVLALVTGSALLLAAQAAGFALGVVAGPRFAPYPVLYRHLVAPCLGPATETRSATSVRSGQGVGLVLACAGALGHLAGAPVTGTVAVALALTAALLDAVGGVRVGRGVHRLALPLITRIRNHQGVTA